MRNLTTTTKSSQLQTIDWWLPDVGGWGLREMGEGGQKAKSK